MNILKLSLLTIIVAAGLSGAAPAHALLMAPIHNAAEVEAKVREVFVNAPDMITIAQCESKFRQYADSGAPLRGGTNGQYIGVFQISEGLANDARDRGFDIYWLDGNLGYAKYMYEQRGTQPWISCLGTKTVTATSPTASPVSSPVATSNPVTGAPISIILKSGMTHPQVLTLQQLLNRAGFVITTSGGGSPGNETKFFGGLTRAAVQKFQCSAAIACSGTEGTTGYGLVGPKTRAALLKLAN